VWQFNFFLKIQKILKIKISQNDTCHVRTKLNLFKELEDQIEPKNNKGTKMKQTNKLRGQNVN